MFRGLLTLLIPVVCLVGCSSNPSHLNWGSHDFASSYLASGTIVLSRQMPKAPLHTAQAQPAELMSPLMGYIPPEAGFLPADNEVWLEIDSSRKTISVHRGPAVIKGIEAEGVVSLKPGTYALQVKQKKPLWYAPDEYFVKRQLPLPDAGNRERYLRGALGGFVLYPTTTFPIHCGPVWTDDVGGLRVSKTDLSSIYYMLPVGSTVVVK